MIHIFKKEINAFFSSLIGYIVVGVFLVIFGLFLWVIPETNIIDYGFASLETLFSITPTIFIFLIPAITMRMFAEEQSEGTIELLSTKPVSDAAIILGKFFAALVLVIFALLPTLLTYWSVSELGAPKGNLDSGAIAGSYIGLLFVAMAFIGIGIFASSISKDQIVAFVIGTFLCFFLFLCLVLHVLQWGGGRCAQYSIFVSPTGW